MKGWYGNKQAHSLASKGIKTKINNTNDITIEIKKILKEWRDDKTCLRPYDINCGMCDELAYLVSEKIDGAEDYWLEDLFPNVRVFENVTHAIILYKNKYYDAENPEGVTSPYDLEVVKNYGKTEYHKKMQGLV